MTPLERFLEHFPERRQSGGQWKARCPSHDDNHASLHIGEGENGGVLLRCFAGCTSEAIVEALGKKMSELMPDRNDRPQSRPAPKADPTYATAEAAIASFESRMGKHTAKWPYHDADGKIIAWAVRWPAPNGKKEFRSFTLFADGWRCTHLPKPRTLFRLNEILDAGVVVVTEGEKAAVAARGLGLFSTTSMGGVDGGKFGDWSVLAGKTVPILPDNDDPGRKYANEVAGILVNLSPPAIVKIIDLPGLTDKGDDIFDWVEERKATMTDAEMAAVILELIDEAPAFTPDAAPRQAPAPPSEQPAAEHFLMDREAERSVIGTILRDPEKWHDVRHVAADDFLIAAHREIWRSIAELVAAGVMAEPIAINANIVARGQEKTVGPTLVADLRETATCDENVACHAEIVLEKSTLRKLDRTFETLRLDARSPGASSRDIRAKAEQAIIDIGKDGRVDDEVTMRIAVERALERLDKRSKLADGEIDFSYRLPTGWNCLDEVIGGLFNSEFVVVAARPGMCKTLWLGCLIDNLAQLGAKIYYASLEQTEEELADRAFCRRGPINSYRLRDGRLNEQEKKRLPEISQPIAELPITIARSRHQSAASIASGARRKKLRGGLDLIVVDYLQIVEAENPRDTRANQVAAISMRLATLAKDLNVPVVALAQLNRNSAFRGKEEPPRLTDLKESGQIEQDAHVVIGFHKPEEFDKDRALDQLELHVLKNRNGPVDVVTLVHHKKIFDIRQPVVSSAPPNMPPAPADDRQAWR